MSEITVVGYASGGPMTYRNLNAGLRRVVEAHHEAEQVALHPDDARSLARSLDYLPCRHKDMLKFHVSACVPPGIAIILGRAAPEQQ